MQFGYSVDANILMMSHDLDEILLRAANSNLTPTAIEFVPRRTLTLFNSSQSQPVPQSSRTNNLDYTLGEYWHCNRISTHFELLQLQFFFLESSRSGSSRFNSQDRCEREGFLHDYDSRYDYPPIDWDGYNDRKNYHERNDHLSNHTDQFGQGRQRSDVRETNYHSKPFKFITRPRNDLPFNVRSVQNSNNNYNDEYYKDRRFGLKQQDQGNARSFSFGNRKSIR